MNKELEKHFKKICEIVDEVSSCAIQSSSKHNAEQAKNLLDYIYTEFMEPLIRIESELHGAELARTYIKKLNGLNTKILPPNETEDLYNWLLERYEYKEDLIEYIDDGEEVDNIDDLSDDSNNNIVS